MRALLSNYTVLLVYGAVTTFAWYYDVRMGMALAIGLPVAFVMGRESVEEHASPPSVRAPRGDVGSTQQSRSRDAAHGLPPRRLRP